VSVVLSQLFPPYPHNHGEATFQKTLLLSIATQAGRGFEHGFDSFLFDIRDSCMPVGKVSAKHVLRAERLRGAMER
jgi:hypothetical protein